MSQKNTGYVSEIDQFITAFDREHTALTESQKKEKLKYQRIFYLRDTPNRPKESVHLDDWF